MVPVQCTVQCNIKQGEGVIRVVRGGGRLIQVQGVYSLLLALLFVGGGMFRWATLVQLIV